MILQTFIGAMILATGVSFIPSKTMILNAQEPPQEVLVQKVSGDTIEAKIEYYGSKYGVLTKMKEILNCENKDLDPTLQSWYTYKHDHPEWGVVKGEREKSFGLVQIHLPSWPDITHAQAVDPDFALDFLARNLSEGKGKLWSCYDIKS